MQSYKLKHITFKTHRTAHSKIPHRMVHVINKEVPHSTAAHTAKSEVLSYKIRAHIPIGYTAYSQ